MKQNRSGMLVLCGAAFLLCSGCGTNKNPAADLLQYMENRYPEDDFTLDHYELQSEQNTYQITEIIITSAQFPDGEIHAKRWKTDKQWFYADNYMAFLLHDDIEACVHEIAERCFGECKVYMSSKWNSVVSSDFPTYANADYYLRSKPECGFAIYLPPDKLSMAEARERLELFKTELSNKEYDTIGVGVDIVADADAYERICSYEGPNESTFNKKDLEFVGGFDHVKTAAQQ